MTAQAKRLFILGAILLAGFGASLLLPEIPAMRPSRLATEIPLTFGDWNGQKVPVSKRELEVLAKDTRFERGVFIPSTASGLPPVEASIVFSGKDLNNSIHRPEVCMKTQGWNFVRQRYVTLPSVLPDGGDMIVREIVCSRTRRSPETNEPIKLPNGKFLEDWQILYYTFIGATDTTASHYGRTFIDIRDRVLGGYDQQWAYATFSSVVPGKYQDQGVDIGTLDPLDLDQTGKHLEAFIRELMPHVLMDPQAVVSPQEPAS